ncbi:MAG: alkaline phosphatase family protein [Alphaproteobacteria bacterium]|nr:alkaline phosphatase family protein [Alphaproteobacteria bacterium]
MKRKIFYPNYDCSILGISNSLLRHYGVDTDMYHLPELEQALKRKYKNVVLLILDGMGVDMLQHDLPFFSFLRRHIKGKISSVFPPTTVAATTSYYSGLSPVEHGWLGWSPYFKKLGRVVEIFTNKDFYTGELLEESVVKEMPYVHIFDRIKSVQTDVQLTGVFPNFIKPDGVSDFDELCQRVVKQTKEDGKQFVLAYWTNPDSTSHEFGPYSKEVKDVLKTLNSKVKQMCANLKDTLVIISADHGHINSKDVMLNDYPDLIDCLAVPLGLDGRAQTVFLKEGKEKVFLDLFKKYLAKDFILVKSNDALGMNLFGYGKERSCVRDFLGDYLIIAKTEKSLVQRFENDTYNYLPGMHSGLTNKEMVVPLILIEKK